MRKPDDSDPRQVIGEQLAYWREQLADLPVLELPTDRPRPPSQSLRGARHSVSFSKSLAEGLRELTRREGATLYTALLAAFQTLLLRYTGQEDIVVGSQIPGRSGAENEDLIGFSANTLVLRTDLSGDPTFRELLQRVREVALGAHAHQDLPFEKMVEELQPGRDLGQDPLFQVLFALQDAPRASLELAGPNVPQPIDTESTHLDLEVHLLAEPDALTCTVVYAIDLFDPETIARMLRHYQRLLESVVEDPERRVPAVDLMSDSERQQVLVEWNQTDREYPLGKTVHRLFEEQAERMPEAVAVVFGEKRLRYRELNERANRLARYLGKLGVGPEVLVGLCVERSLEMVVGLLGILKADGAYVPLDPGYPRQRVKFMVEDSGAPVVLTQESLSDVLPEGDFERVRLDADWAEIERESGENPEGQATAENLAYVIYTSGSTGTPKGVAIEHHSTVALLAWARDFFSGGELEGVLASSSICFDLSVFELFAPLTYGGTVILSEDALHLPALPAAAEVKLVNTVPSAMAQLIRMGELPASVGTVNLAGEPLPTSLVREILQSGNVGRVFDLYGPTEDTTYSTCALRSAEGLATIGRPISNKRVYILDAHLQPVPVGVPGDLYVAGAGVARGYLNRPELTAEKFLPDPFRGNGARMYRTGDRARFLSDGQIEFLGRLDQQVKIRGYRIEIGEIEEALSRHSEVQACAVVARQEESGDKRLVGYVVAAKGVSPSVTELRGFLKNTLPDYMVPSAFLFLDALPLTPNGKIDRRSLPLPPPDRPNLDTPFVSPRTAVEETLCEMCAELLSLELVGIEDNFFELGGHSLIATQLLSRIRTAFRVELPLDRFFESPTVRETAANILRAQQEETDTAAVSIPRAPRTEDLPLSLAQEQVWFLQQLEPDNRAYQFQPTLHFHGELDTGALERSLVEIVRRHEIYRTTFPAIAGAPVQRIHESAPAPLAVLDLQEIAEDTRDTELRRRLDQEIRRPFDLTKLPLVRWTLFRLGPEEHVLQHVEHHMVHDGWSFNVFLRELATLYRSFHEGRPSPLPEPEIQFGDFASFQREWMKSDQATAQRQYWTKKLAGAPAALEIPSDRPRPAVQTFRGAVPVVELPVDLAESLRALSRREGCTLFMTMLATFATLLYRYTDREEFCIGSGVADPRWQETEGLIGMLVNVVALRMDLGGDPSFTDLLRRVRDVTLEGYENQDYPFAAVVDAVQPERSLSHSPLCQVLFSFHDSPLGDLDFGGLQLDLQEIVSNGSAKFDLNIICIPRSEQRVGQKSKSPAGGITLAWEYNTDLFDEPTARRMIGHFETLLRCVVADPERPVSSMPLLTEAEKRAVLQEWNCRPAASPRARLHESFERQVERTPDAVAVEFEGERLTYGELNRRCNQLAWHLRKLGVGPNVLVGVCLERSLEMVVALIGVLKSGGAYVPLDPAYPAERLAFMLEDARTPVLLTEGKLLESLQIPGGVRVFLMDRDAEMIGREEGRNPERLGSPESPAYVIYTSGSTGKPKGVLVTHANVDRLFTATEPWFQFDERDVWTLFHSYAFDFSVWELWGALRYGGRLVVVPLGVARSPEAFHALLARSGVTVLNQTPSAFRQLIAQDEACADSLSLRLVIFGGEALEPEMLRPWFDRHSDESPRLVNMYGITETTVHVTYHPVTRADLLQPSVSVIGRPIPDLQVYILDRHLQLCPIGVPGELHVAGAGLARGYLRRPELTAERFIPNPFATEPGERLYKTGDLGRYRPDGEIEYLGRVDQQVKIRGHRIELGEIESVLGQHPGVQEAVVVAREEAPGDRRLVAYVVPDQKSAYTVRQLLRLEREGQLTGHSRHELPNGMVIVHLNESETDFVYNEIFAEQSYLRHGITLHDGDYIFDIGANIGLFTLFAGHKYKRLTIYAFEPIPPIFQLLRINTALYDLNVKLFDCGIASEVTTDTFTYYPNISVISGRFADAQEETETVRAFVRNQLQTSLSDTAVSGEALDELLQERLASERFTCRLRTISDVMQEHGVDRIDLLKIDVEKSELDVFAGIGEDDWPKIRQIVVEVHDIEGRLEHLKSLLQRRGYDLTIEQDSLLKDTGLHNIYAIRPSPEQTAGGSGDTPALEPEPIWSSPKRLVGDLRRFLREKLPEYMVPAGFVLLEALLLTPSGKIDRRALPAPSFGREGLDTPFAAPRSQVEKTVCEICAELLGLETVGIDDNFFELGGHSLIATQVVSRIRTTFHIELPLGRFFDSPTVREIAAEIVRAVPEQTDVVSIERVRRTGDPPLSLSQQNVWFLQQLEPDNRAYQIQPTLRFHGELDIGALERSLAEIVRRHEIYRTTFPAVAGVPIQRIHESASPSLAVVELQEIPPGAREAELHRRMDEEIRRPFDLTKLPLIRWTLFRLAPQEHVLLHVEHHLVHDGWSLNVFLRELATLYRSFHEGQPSPLPEPKIQFADFAAFQRRWMESEQASAQRTYWTKKLAGAPAALEIPSDRPRPAVQTFRGATPLVELPVDLAESLRALSRREGRTLFMTMLATFATLLYRYTGREDFCIGSGIADRRWRETEGLIGMLVNMVPLRMNLGGDPSFTELLRRVRNVTLEGYENQDYPFAAVVDAIQPERTLSHSPLCQVLFSFHDSPLADLDFGDLQMDLQEFVGNGSAKFDLNIICIPRSEQRVGQRSKAPAGGITLAWEYNTDLFDEPTIHRMIGHFETLLRAVAADPQRPVSSLPLLTEAEKHTVLQEWNSRAAASPMTSLHEPFERRVERAPDAVAIEFEGERLNYRELNRRSNQLAWHLRDLGARPDALVGICLERSVEMVIAIIGVLKSGAAYLPLDPGYPAERLAFMLGDAQTGILITDTTLLDLLQIPEGVRVCLMDEDAEEISRKEERNPELLGSPENAAYVIYTSGSTGKPKGVLVTHGNVDRLFTATEPWFGFNERDVWTLFHSYAFDFSVWEFWGALRYGGRLIVIPRAVTRSPAAFHELLVRSRVTVLNQTPSAFRQLIAHDASSTESLGLRLVIFGGEALEPGMLKPWFERHGDESPRLVNMYGITETTVHVTYHPMTRDDLLQSRSVIGRPIPDLQVYILDRHMQLCPIGVPGELHVAGAGLARGYLRRPELTSERFIPNPFAPDSGQRLYRTGDLGRYRSDGEIEYLGRIDQQVKIRGHRIELGEIESVLGRHPAVEDAVVAAREDTPGDKRLVAYVVPDPQSAYTVRQLLRLEREGLIDNRSRYELPNGMVIVHQNRAETDFVYHEIFAEQSYLRHGVTLHDGDCVFDIGANIGLFTLFVGHRCKGLTIYAFEPIPPIFQLLSTNMALYDLNVRLFDCGIANEAKSDTFTYYPHDSVISGRFANAQEERETVRAFLLNQPQTSQGGTAPSREALDELLRERLTSERFTCQLRTISDVIQENGVERIDLLKIDVEKSELDVLAGILEDDWPKIRQVVVEVHDIDGRLEHIKALLQHRGYDLAVEQDNLLKETGLYNIYAVRPATGQTVSGGRGGTPAAEAGQTWSSPNVLLADLRHFLKEKLPEYMVPSIFVPLERLPLTPSGKVDRKALPAPDATRPELKDAFVAPQTEAEKLLAEIWAQVLKVERVGIHDNFFELGGDSILSIQIVARANQAGLRLAPKHLFEHQTIAELAAAAEATQAVRADQRPVTGFVPLTPIQRWFFERNSPEPHHFNQSFLLTVRHPLDATLLDQAVRQLLMHHDALRLRFFQEEGVWRQINAAAEENSVLFRLDLSGLSAAEQAARIESAAAKLQASLDLARGPLLRVALFDLGVQQASRLLIVIHHLAVDGVSWRVLLEDLQTAYLQLSGGDEIALPAKTTSFKAWAESLTSHAQSDSLKREAAFWLTYPGDGVRPLPNDFPGGANTEGSARRISVSLSASETQRLLQEVPSAYRTQINDVLLAAFARALAPWAASGALVVDLEGHGREEIVPDVDVSRTVGWFTTIFPVLLDLDSAADPGDALKLVKERLRAIPNRGIGYGLLRYSTTGDSDIAAQLEALPQAEASFNYLGQFDQVLSESSLFALSGESSGPAHNPRGLRRHLLDVQGLVSGGRLRVDWFYSENVHRRTTVERLSAGFLEALRTLIAHCQSLARPGFTPSDFPLAGLNQERLDRVLRRFGKQ